MEIIITSLMGIFIGSAITGYIAISKLDKKNRQLDNQKAMIRRRDDLIDYQCNQLKQIKEIVSHRYYTAETIESKIKSVLSNTSNN